jgi:hypothetical protein
MLSCRDWHQQRKTLAAFGSDCGSAPLLDESKDQKLFFSINADHIESKPRMLANWTNLFFNARLANFLRVTIYLYTGIYGAICILKTTYLLLEIFRLAVL